MADVLWLEVGRVDPTKPHDALTIHGESVRWYQSSENVRQGFCGTCASTLFWSPKMEGCEHIAVALGIIDGPTGARVRKHTFVGDKGDYYDIPGDVERSDGL